jgi:hypothetical protein
VASVANGPPNEPHLRTTRSVFASYFCSFDLKIFLKENLKNFLLDWWNLFFVDLLQRKNKVSEFF